MGRYVCNLTLKQHYELVIEADSYEEAVQIAVDTDVANFVETRVATERLEIKELS